VAGIAIGVTRDGMHGRELRPMTTRAGRIVAVPGIPLQRSAMRAVQCELVRHVTGSTSDAFGMERFVIVSLLVAARAGRGR